MGDGRQHLNLAHQKSYYLFET